MREGVDCYLENFTHASTRQWHAAALKTYSTHSLNANHTERGLLYYSRSTEGAVTDDRNLI